MQMGAVPRFLDVAAESWTLDPGLLERELARAARRGRLPRVVVPVDLFGNVAPIPALRELGVPVVEDAAQAAGAALQGTRAGALGEIATFSFFPSKNLPCLGDGGAIVTDDDDLAEAFPGRLLNGERVLELIAREHARVDEQAPEGHPVQVGGSAQHDRL